MAKCVFCEMPESSAAILGLSVFPNLISKPFMDGMRIVLYVGAFIALIAAIASAWPSGRRTESKTARSAAPLR